MTRFNVLLLIAVMSSGLYLVKTSHDARQLFAELDHLQVEQRRLDVDYQRLQTEAQAEATHLRVERVAREKLQMRAATPAVTQYVDDGGAK